MKSLLVYYSFTGNNKLLINTLEDKLKCDLHEIKDLKKRSKFTIFLDMLFHRNPKINSSNRDISNYDLVIFTAPIWMETVASPLKTFLIREGQKVNKYAFVTLSGVKGNRYIERDLIKYLGKKPLKITELAVNSLFEEDNKETADYKVRKEEMKAFDKEINTFVEEIVKIPMHV